MTIELEQRRYFSEKRWAFEEGVIVSYLIHYNKNHSKANGQFVSGDGDGDGISNDHAHKSTVKQKRLRIKGTIKIASGSVALGVGVPLSIYRSIKSHEEGKDFCSKLWAAKAGIGLVFGTSKIVSGFILRKRATELDSIKTEDDIKEE